MAETKVMRVPKMYSLKDGKIERKSKFCPRCGPGVFMAHHVKGKPRYACGKCGYTEFEKARKR